MSGSGGGWWLRLEVAPADAELAADRLWAEGATAVREDDGVLTAGYLDRASARSAAAVVAGFGPTDIGQDDGAWRSEWRRHAVPVEVGPFLIRTPNGPAGDTATRGPAPEGRIVIDIDPGDAFGSGHHTTTRQCLAALAELVGPGTKLLDVGSGSGILSVAGARLGAGPVVSLDIDHRSSLVSRANGLANGVDLQVVTGTLAAVRGPFDLVVANLGGALVPIAMAGALAGLTRPGGTLVVAGLLADGGQGDSVQRALDGFVPEGSDGRDGWLALRMRRRSTPP